MSDLTIDCNDPVAPLGSYNSAQTNFIPTAPRTGSLVVSNNVPVQVVDNSCGTMTFNVNAGYPISVTDLNLSLNFDHTWLSDNVITLTSPNGTVFTLLDGVCGGPFPINTTFDDECTNTSTLCADLATATCFRPTFGPLSIFDGGTGNGAWTLSICDDAAGDVGTIISASLSISYVERAHSTAPAVAENCSSYSLTYRDVVNNQQCTGDCWKTITRTWTAVDASSYRNVGTCV